MVVKCMNDKAHVGFTKGELYKVRKVKENTYSVKNDRGSVINVKKEHFKKKCWIYDLFAID